MKRSRLKRKSRTELAKLKDELWELCKQLTRQVYGHNCYTCGTYVQYPHTGHFITHSTCSTEIAYDLRNLRPQCYACNVHRSGNWIVFEENLIRDHGRPYVEQLKKDNQKTKGKSYREDWYIQKIAEYRGILEKE